MASLCTYKRRSKSGTAAGPALCRLTFEDDQGVRRTIYLGPMPTRDAKPIKVKVEEIIAAKLGCQPFTAEVASWLGKLDSKLYEKLVGVQLVDARVRPQSLELGKFFDDFVASQIYKEGTRRNYQQAKQYLLGFLAPDKPIGQITHADALDWRQYLLKHRKQVANGAMKPLAENTIRSWCKCVKAVFSYAVKKRIIESNPFSEIPTKTQALDDRKRFITAEDFELVLQATEDPEWKAIFSLCRYGGLRCPSEVLALRWEDIDFVSQRILVHSSKTEHHIGKDVRVVPLFPQLKLCFEELRSTKGAEGFVIKRYRKANQNLATQAVRIIKQAGIKPWPKVFQNLRSTRQTELGDCGFTTETVCKWLGNSPEIARKHYLQVTDEHFARAVEVASVAQVTRPVARKPAQSHELGAQESSETVFASLMATSPCVENDATCGLLQSALVPLRDSNMTRIPRQIAQLLDEALQNPTLKNKTSPISTQNWPSLSQCGQLFQRTSVPQFCNSFAKMSRDKSAERKPLVKVTDEGRELFAVR